MKMIFTLLAVFIISLTAAFAQTATPTTQHLKKDGTVDKRYKSNKSTTSVPPPASTGSSPTSNDIKTSEPSSTTHLKKDGTPDKRYSNSKKPATAATPAVTPSPAVKPAPSGTKSTPTGTVNAAGKHLKADGTPDMRYKENRIPGLDKDGSPDKRHKKNKTI